MGTYELPPPYDMEPRPGKKTLGNRRTGNVRGTRSRRATLTWDKDPMILGRMQLVEKLWAQGYSTSQMVPAINEKMRELGVPPVSERTIKRDKSRLLEKFENETVDARTKHIEALQLVKRTAWEDHDKAPVNSLNKSTYLNTIRATEETIAKLDGSLTNKVQIDGSLTHTHQAEILVGVLVRHFGEEKAEVILEEVDQEIQKLQDKKEAVN